MSPPYVGRGGFLRLPLSPLEKEKPLDDGLDIDVDWAAWLVPELLEDEHNTVQDSESTLADLFSTPSQILALPSSDPLSTPLPLPHAGQDSFNEGDSESSKTRSKPSVAGDSIISRSSSPLEARGSASEHGETLIPEITDTRDMAATGMPRISEDVGYMNLPKVMGMQEFIQFQVEGTQEYSADNAQLNLDAVYVISQEVQHLSNWPLDAHYRREQHSEFFEASTTHQDSHDPSIYIFPPGEHALSREHQLYSFQNETLSSFKTSPAAHKSRSSVEHWLNETSNSGEINKSFDHNSPTRHKHSQTKEASHQLENTTLEQGTGFDKCVRFHVPSSDSQPSPQLINSTAHDKGAESLSQKELTDMCKSYVSEHYHLPSDEKTVVLPRHNQPSTKVSEWLNSRIEKQKERDANRGFDSPHVLQYEPLGDLAPQNEKHEAARCRRAAELIFDQDTTGQSDWYDHGMEGAYHFIPKEETDKWNDDSNWFITGKEFSQLVDDMYPDPKSVELPQRNTNEAADDIIIKDEVTASNTNIKDQTLEEVKPSREEDVGKDQLEWEPPLEQDTSLTKKETTDEQIVKDQQIKKPETESLTADGTIQEQILDQLTQQTEDSAIQLARVKNVHSLTPTGETKRKVARLDTTPQRSTGAVEPFYSAKSLDSVKTAIGSPQVAEITADDQSMPIPSFHTDRTTTPTRQYPSSSKIQKPWYGSQDKITRNVIAAVDNIREQLESHVSSAAPPNIVSWGNTRPELRQLQPSPIEGYSSRAHLGSPRNAFGREGFPSPSGIRRSTLSSSLAPAPQPAQSSNPQPIRRKVGPVMGTFFPMPYPHNQQTQQFGADQHRSFTTGNYHLDARGNRAGYGQQTGSFQPNRNRGHGQIAQTIANNPMQYPMAHYQACPAQMDVQQSETSLGNKSENGTITSASRFHEPPGYSGRGYQPTTPNKSTEPWQQMSSGSSSFASLQLTLAAPANQGKTVEPFDPRTPRTIDATPIKFNLPPSAPRITAREKVVINCQRGKECAKTQRMLENAAKEVPARRIMLTETFMDRPTKIILSAPAGDNLRGWVLNLLPHAQVDASMY